MNIAKAIEILKTLTRIFRPRLNVYERDAVKLGIEALKKWQTLREGRAGIIDPLLPGETKD